MLETIKIFTSWGVVLSSLGLVLATSSFIGGLQLIKGARRSSVERKIHRFNGITSLSIYIILAISSLATYGLGAVALFGWICGLGLILFKLWIIRTQRRAFKYVPWLGVCIVLMWLYILYINMKV
jgi:hypothetical protein